MIIIHTTGTLPSHEYQHHVHGCRHHYHYSVQHNLPTTRLWALYIYLRRFSINTLIWRVGSLHYAAKTYWESHSTWPLNSTTSSFVEPLIADTCEPHLTPFWASFLCEFLHSEILCVAIGGEIGEYRDDGITRGPSATAPIEQHDGEIIGHKLTHFKLSHHSSLVLWIQYYIRFTILFIPGDVRHDLGRLVTLSGSWSLCAGCAQPEIM